MTASRFLQSRVRVALFCLLGVAFNAFLLGPALKLSVTGINDFMAIYSGARLAFTGGMYNMDRNLAVQQETAGWENVNRLFLRPPFDALLVWPLGRLPFLQANLIWLALIVVTICLFCYLWPGDRKAAALVCCWSYPLLHVFAQAQDIALLMLLVVLGMREMKRGREFNAGLWFSLCSIKVHLFLLLPVLILTQKRWRLGAGLLSGGAALFAISYLPAGPGWPSKYAALLSSPVSNPWPEYMPNVHGLVAGLPHSSVWEIAGMLAVAFLTWIACRKGGFEYGLAAVLAGGVLVAPHAYIQDAAMAIPAVLITFPLAATAPRRYVHLFLASPFFGVWAIIDATWVTAFAIIAYLASLSTGEPVSSSDYSLPLHTLSSKVNPQISI
jgi:hypothetical protein